MDNTPIINRNNKYGLHFEQHPPDPIRLHDQEIENGMHVIRKGNLGHDIYKVVDIIDAIAVCQELKSAVVSEHLIQELIPAIEPGKPLFPTLTEIDSVNHGDANKYWHTLIEADNFYALQMLQPLYANQIDVIYIDPPYNTGSSTSKYRNKFSHPYDKWEHSYYLSFLSNRFKIARNLLNPDSGVLICACDEHHVHHIRILLEQIFVDATFQTVTIVNNPRGVAQSKFSRVEEYAIFVFMPNASAVNDGDAMLGETSNLKKPIWKGLLRSGNNASRDDGVNMYYPIIIDPITKRIAEVGNPLKPNMTPIEGLTDNGMEIIWPLKRSSQPSRWYLSHHTFRQLVEKGFAKVGKRYQNPTSYGITYLTKKQTKQLETGELSIVGYDEIRNVNDVAYSGRQNKRPKTVWHRQRHDSNEYGTKILANILGRYETFSYPKSIYTVKDCLAAVTMQKPDALILDLFAGSGTTMDAVNLLNYEDKGSRRCILITNNEVSEVDAEQLIKKGYVAGEKFWEEQGICRSVTWPRIYNSVSGVRRDGSVMSGEYQLLQQVAFDKPRSIYQLSFVSELKFAKSRKQLLSIIGKDKLPPYLVNSDNAKYIISPEHTATILFDDAAFDDWISDLSLLEDQNLITDLYVVTKNDALFNQISESINYHLGPLSCYKDAVKPLCDGFLANVAYFRLDFDVPGDRHTAPNFSNILKLLWLKSGCIGRSPTYSGCSDPKYIIPSESNFALLVDYTFSDDFIQNIKSHGTIKDIYIASDDDVAFEKLKSSLFDLRIIKCSRDFSEFLVNWIE